MATTASNQTTTETIDVNHAWDLAGQDLDLALRFQQAVEYYAQMERFHGRLLELVPVLRRRAEYVAHGSPDADADDLVQHMVLRILERAAADPAFMEREDVEITTFATWRAKNRAEAGRVYGQYVEPETFIDDDQGNEISLFELIADKSAVNPEDAYIETERISLLADIVRSLSPENQQLVCMVYQGYSQNEIAARLGVTKGAISQRKGTIARAFSKVLDI